MYVSFRVDDRVGMIVDEEGLLLLLLVMGASLLDVAVVYELVEFRKYLLLILYIIYYNKYRGAENGCMGVCRNICGRIRFL